MFRAYTYQLVQNVFAVFRGRNLLWHVAAGVATFLLVTTGFDWWFFEATRFDQLKWFILAAGIGGFFIPLVVAVGLYIFGDIKKNKHVMWAGAAVGQASFLAWLISSTYKAFTGRVQPEFLTHFNLVDNSKDFNFGFFEYGIFWGWPSSHTAVAVAGAIALVYMYPRVRTTRYLAIFYAIFIAVGAMVGFHWFSDVLAGAIVGAIVGVVVGKSFYNEVRPR